MANPRKVQGEIDKLLKKVQEGMEVYESIFEKVNSAPDRVQKEKFEAELKKEIKKLQRLREQIKALHTNPEVKDKKQLEVTRRAIEIKMEGFKVCERETKTKAFSKEGLATNKTDPAARAKAKTQGWINNAIQELQDQVEQLEFDLENEGVQPSKKSKKGSGDEREDRMARNKHHILKLEAILRVLEIGDIEPEDVDEIEIEVTAFVEGFQDPLYEEDEEMDIYEMFDLPEGIVQDIVAGVGRDESDDEDATKEAAAAAATAAGSPGAAPPKKEAAPQKAPTPPQKVAPKPAAKKIPAPEVPTAKKAPSPAVPVKAPAPAPVAVAAAPKTPITPLTAVKGPGSPASGAKSMAAILAGNRGESDFKAPAAAAKPAATEEMDALDEDDENNDDTFGDDIMDSIQPGGGSLADLASMTTTKIGGDWAKPLPAAVAGSANAAATNPLGAGPKLPPASPLTSSKQAPPSATTPAKTTTAAAVQPSQQPQQQAVPSTAPTAPPSQRPAQSAAAPGSLGATAAVSSSGASRAPVASYRNADVILRMLSTSLRNLPHTSDCERPKPYTPPNPYQTPDYYPQSVHPAFNFPETFQKFETDTLFFIFYYQQASYQQYLAAKELKRQSWRFHKKFQTWFQRHDRPKVTNEEHEQGTYIYFDYEGGWCQRIKADFIFRYSHLEDSLV
jgi:CCR4-NOT transcription complex subunit 3